MTDALTTEAARLALKLVATTDHDDNEQAFLAALKAYDTPHEQLSVAFNATRILALQIREHARIAGTLDLLVDHANSIIFESLLDDPEDQP